MSNITIASCSSSIWIKELVDIGLLLNYDDDDIDVVRSYMYRLDVMEHTKVSTTQVIDLQAQPAAFFKKKLGFLSIYFGRCDDDDVGKNLVFCLDQTPKQQKNRQQLPLLLLTLKS